MSKKTFKINLTDVDTTSYEKNPIVTLSRSDKVIGKAVVSSDKQSVEVEFVDDVPEFDHSLVTSTINSDEGEQLTELSVIPVRGPKGA